MRLFGPLYGQPEAVQCIAEVENDHDAKFHQCPRKRGLGPDGLYCKQHAKEYVKAC